MNCRGVPAKAPFCLFPSSFLCVYLLHLRSSHPAPLCPQSARMQRTHTDTHGRAHVCTHTQTCTRAHTHRHAHTYSHRHTHTLKQLRDPGCLGPPPELGPVGCMESPIPTPSDQHARLSSTCCRKLPWAPGIRRLGKLFRCFSPLWKWEAWPHSAVGSDETSHFREMGARWAMGGQCRGA